MHSGRLSVVHLCTLIHRAAAAARSNQPVRHGARDTAIDPTTQTVYTANSNDTMSVIEAARRS